MFQLFPRATTTTATVPPRGRPPSGPSPRPAAPPEELRKYVSQLPSSEGTSSTTAQQHWMKLMSAPSPAAAAATTSSPLPTYTPSSQTVWGPIHWNFLHTLAEKLIDDAAFARCRESFLAILQHVCSILPCPRCVNHAKQYLDQVQWQRIRTRADMIEFLWLFHNFVNWRTKETTQPRDVLTEYAGKNTGDVVKAYFTLIQHPSTFAYHTNLNHTMVRTVVIKQIHTLLTKCNDCLRQ